MEITIVEIIRTKPTVDAAVPSSSNVRTEEIASQIHTNATEITIVEIIRTKPTVVIIIPGISVMYYYYKKVNSMVAVKVPTGQGLQCKM
ncbi:unnamed protein product [Allacma fusca]|uniref:Uncharacterized protein n=1 Tax=Allacma fusca TaxID=39272 RepID=A0A8J2JUH9_9HEXA|nr:unnamed protein product [Allacma fusca]